MIILDVHYPRGPLNGVSPNSSCQYVEDKKVILLVTQSWGRSTPEVRGIDLINCIQLDSWTQTPSGVQYSGRKGSLAFFLIPPDGR